MNVYFKTQKVDKLLEKGGCGCADGGIRNIKMAYEFSPMRSMIFTDVAKEEYRHKLLKWHMLHVEDSIAQFQPYATKYSFIRHCLCRRTASLLARRNSICVNITG